MSVELKYVETEDAGVIGMHTIENSMIIQHIPKTFFYTLYDNGMHDGCSAWLGCGRVVKHIEPVPYWFAPDDL